jgi:hypothetical protein
MSEAKPRAETREFEVDDARAMARALIQSDVGRQSDWSATAVETLTAIILWEACKGAGEG